MLQGSGLDSGMARHLQHVPRADQPDDRHGRPDCDLKRPHPPHRYFPGAYLFSKALVQRRTDEAPGPFLGIGGAAVSECAIPGTRRSSIDEGVPYVQHQRQLDDREKKHRQQPTDQDEIHYR